MKRRIEAIRRHVRGIPRIFAVALVVLLLAATLFSMMVTMHIVTVVDADGTRRTLLTSSKRPQEIVELAGLSTSRHDEIVYTASEGGGPANVTIFRAFPVTVQADGATLSANFVDGTVQDLIDATGVQLGPDDYIDPAPATPLVEGLSAQVHRVTFSEETRREELTDEEADAYHTQLGAELDFKTSYNGQYDVTYRDRFVDGALHSSEVLSVVPVLTPRPKDSYEFIPGVPCSRIEGYDDVEMSSAGLPVNYTRVWEGAVCTAYSASRGRGSSGLGLYCGTAAVNPNVIPYGTRMFITSADGKFVYGFCIATDTGTAMMEGYVDLDLFFETNAECRQFGKRQLNVYFLD